MTAANPKQCIKGQVKFIFVVKRWWRRRPYVTESLLILFLEGKLGNWVVWIPIWPPDNTLSKLSLLNCLVFTHQLKLSYSPTPPLFRERFSAYFWSTPLLSSIVFRWFAVASPSCHFEHLPRLCQLQEMILAESHRNPNWETVWLQLWICYRSTYKGYYKVFSWWQRRAYFCSSPPMCSSLFSSFSFNIIWLTILLKVSA